MNEVQCSMAVCENVLNDGELKFYHNGKCVGGICDDCLGKEKKARVVFAREDDGPLLPDHITFLNTI
jgi:hypothetical protein